jgi:hypothetical protein
MLKAVPTREFGRAAFSARNALLREVHGVGGAQKIRDAVASGA